MEESVSQEKAMFAHRCPHCKSVHKRSIEVAGKTVRCPCCRRLLALPNVATIVGETLDLLGIPRKYRRPSAWPRASVSGVRVAATCG
jgi:hypothetical protein